MIMKIAFFSAKEYETDVFTQSIGKENMKITFFEEHLNEKTVALTAGFDVVCVFVNDKVSEEVIDGLCKNKVSLLALRCAGYNNVALEYAYGKIPIVRVPAYSPYAVAEHGMALLLTLVRKTHKAYNRTRDFNFDIDGLTGFDLHGKTVGVVGTGKIGRCFIDICKGFGMKVIAYDKFPAEELKVEYVSLKKLFMESDIISLHCPLNEETLHLVDKAMISVVKEGVIIINTSRGALVDSEALIEGLTSGKIGAAGLDVYEEEENLFFEDWSEKVVRDDNIVRLISMPNVLITSHQAFLTKEALENIAFTTINNISTFFTEGRCENKICYNCTDFGKCTKSDKKRCFSNNQ